MSIKLNALSRTVVGKGASRRLRRQDQVPAIIYGAGKPSLNLMLSHKEVKKAAQAEDFTSQIIALTIDGKDEEQVILKDYQRHVFKPQFLHLDFLRIKATEKITMHIPLHFKGETVAPGLKQGGIFARTMSDIEIRCLPADLPRFIEVDVSEMSLNDTIHVTDLKLPPGVEIPALVNNAEYDAPIITLHIPHMEEETPTPAAVTEEEAAAAAEGEAAAGTAATEGETAKSEKKAASGKEKEK